MTLLKRSTLLLLVPVLMFTACSSDSSSSDELVGNWVSRFSFNGNARSEAVTFTIGNKAYVGAGIANTAKRLKDFWEYDATTNLWRKIKTFPGDARSGAVAFSVNGKGYFGTGYNDNGEKLKDFYEYTPGANATDSGTWTRIGDFAGTARLDATGFAVGNKGYIISGDDGSYLKDFWEFTPGGAGTWVEKSFPGNKRRDGLAFVVGDKAYFGTGVNNNAVVSDFWEYNPAASEATAWTRKRDIANTNTETYDDNYTTITRSSGSAFVINSKGFICTGENGANPSECWQYDPSNDTWVRKTVFEGAGRTSALGVTVNGKGLIMTGRSGSSISNPFDDLWEFFPDATQVDND